MKKKYLLDVTSKCQKFMERLPPKQFKQIAKAVLSLGNDPYPQDSIHLKGNTPYRRKDVGEYRVVYRVDGDIVRVPNVGKRNDSDVYKGL